ncbi:hypothetical protein [Rufibacter roseus]|uniref:Uncharacterized protein n=2 Tax=Rufibacter roseus TaxID=1567108 RepID=A0ABW2DKN0_9BACT|nr:hypothetical protein [Rufibacter roseus]
MGQIIYAPIIDTMQLPIMLTQHLVLHSIQENGHWVPDSASYSLFISSDSLPEANVFSSLSFQDFQDSLWIDFKVSPAFYDSARITFVDAPDSVSTAQSIHLPFSSEVLSYQNLRSKSSEPSPATAGHITVTKPSDSTLLFRINTNVYKMEQKVYLRQETNK